MRRAILPILFLLTIPLLPTVVFAFTVTITQQDLALGGTTTSLLSLNSTGITPVNCPGTTSGCTQVVVPLTQNELTCGPTSVSACTIFLPSKKSVQQVGDLFKIQDSSSTARARIILTVSGTDRLELKGALITVLNAGTAGRKLKITAQSASGDYPNLMTTTAYNWTANLSGTFTNGTTRATSCPAPQTALPAPLPAGTTPCVLLTLTVSLASATSGTVQEAVNTNGTIATVSVPPDPQSTSPTTGGTYGSSGNFVTTDTRNLGCPAAPCTPKLTADYSAIFKTAGDKLSLPGSGFTGGCTIGVEQDQCIFDLARDCPDCLLFDSQFRLWTGQQFEFDFECTGGAGCGGKFKKTGGPSNIPFFWTVRTVLSTSPVPTEFTAVFRDDSALASLSEENRQLLSSSYLLLLPQPLPLSGRNGISEISLNTYALTIGSQTVDGLPPIIYTDCLGGSFFVLLRILDNGVVTRMVINLGTEPTTSFTTNCSLNPLLPNTNLVTNGDARVVIDGVSGNFTFAQAVRQFSNSAKVLSVSVVLHALCFATSTGAPACATGFEVNQLLELNSATVAAGDCTGGGKTCQQFVFSSLKPVGLTDPLCPLTGLPNPGRIQITGPSGTFFVPDDGGRITVSSSPCGWKANFNPSGPLNPGLYTVEAELGGRAQPTASSFTIIE